MYARDTKILSDAQEQQMKPSDLMIIWDPIEQLWCWQKPRRLAVEMLKQVQAISSVVIK